MSLSELQSGSEYEHDEHTDTTSTREEFEVAPSAPSLPPLSQRKRRRSQSEFINPQAANKKHLIRYYNDAYRSLLNENVASAAARSKTADYVAIKGSQIGASTWSSEEKSRFFVALETLGRDDIRGIANAVGTKSIVEAQHYLTTLQDAATKRGDVRVTLRDIPAAMEVGAACTERLELAGEALAWYQEQFEVKEEQERFGEYWLITPEIAAELEDAMDPSRAPSLVSSPPPGSGALDAQPAATEDASTLKILEHVPEGELFVVSYLLQLSERLFMNGSTALSTPFPNWSSLISPFATKPSIYRSALMDLHTLVVSLTKRLMQVSLVQATSRVRSQGWRLTKTVKPFVKRRDVLTAIDMLKLPRDGKERWRGVARRCYVQVFEGEGKKRRDISWNEVEHRLHVRESSADIEQWTPEGIPTTERDAFKARAARSGTPLPEHVPSAGADSGGDTPDREYEDEGSNTDSDLSQTSLHSSAGSPAASENDATSGQEGATLEAFDAEAGRNEEARLWDLLGSTSSSLVNQPSKDGVHSKTESEDDQSERIVTTPDGWRDWLEYHAEWEDVRVPVPESKFLANRKPNTPLAGLDLTTPQTGEPGTDTEVFSADSSTDEDSTGRPRKRRKASQTEIPIRSSRSYAAYRERISGSHDRDEDSEDLHESIEQGDGEVSPRSLR